MSLFKKIGKVVKKVAKVGAKVVGKVAGFIPGPIGTVAGAVGAIGSSSRGQSTQVVGASMLPALPTIAAGAARVVPAVGRVISKLSPTAAAFGAARAAGLITRGGKATAAGRAAIATGAVAAGGVLLDQFGNPVRRRRRINPLNARALNRALRRIEKAKKMAKRINAVTIRKEKC